MSQYPAIIDVTDLDGSNGFRIELHDQYARTQVASAGDLNGDGFVDLIIGDSHIDSHGVDSGSAYVVFGSAAGFGSVFDVADLDGSNGFRIDGPNAQGYLGKSVSSAGDVNGDGFDDVIVGGPRDAKGGAAYVVFGHEGGFDATLDAADLNGANGFRLVGVPFQQAGYSVAAAGDINGDGIADLVIGALGPHGEYAQGESYVVFGKTSGFDADVSLGSLDGSDGFRIIDSNPHDHSGFSVSGAGDVNGDGIDDLLVGAPLSDAGGYESGAAYVIYGDAAGFDRSIDLAHLHAADGFEIIGGGAGGRAGWSVSSAGDVNGDGIGDIVLGSPYAGRGENFTGAAYVVFGQAGGFGSSVDVGALSGSDGFRIEGFGKGDMTGFSVASAGDVNGDGFDDLIIGAPKNTPKNHHSGGAYVVFGGAGGFPDHINVQTLDGTNGFRIQAPNDHFTLGYSVASAGDLNHDGLSDLIIGGTYVVYGIEADTSLNLVGTDASQTLAGGTNSDKLSGLGGDDVLWGNDSKDKLDGGAGDDTLIGGRGQDNLTGGAGDDVFKYLSTGDSPKGSDLITDLQAGDRIDLSLIDADVTQDGDQAFHLVTNFTHHAGELKLSLNEKGFTIVQADVNGDGQADLNISIAGDHRDFTDFIL